MKRKVRKQIMVVQSWHLELSHSVHRGICDYVRLHPDWETSCIGVDRLELEDTTRWAVDGMIASMSRDQYELLTSTNYPVVSTYASKSIPETIPQVDEDHTKTGILAADYLQTLGHENFACIYPNFASAHTIRAESFAKRLQENGMETSMLGIKAMKLHECDVNVGQWLHDLPKPVALFATNDRTARQLLTLCLETQITVPNDIAILGCENDLGLCEGVTPAISSIQLPYRRIGFEAARTLDMLMQGKKIKKPRTLFPPERVVTRASTDTLASPDPHLRRAVQYIRDHVDEKIDVHALAAHAGLSLRVLQGRFQTELNRSPLEEARRAKIERIKDLLISTDLTLEEIADHTGFSTICYLGRLFKNYTNVTPGQYRKEHRLR